MPIFAPTAAINLASRALGARTLSCSDDFFGALDRLIDDAPPVFVPGKYDDNGKWMDGWESRRRRDDGHDWCVLALAAPGHIDAIEIDTRHFTGNFPAAAGLWALAGDSVAETPAADDPRWRRILAPSALKGDAGNAFMPDAAVIAAADGRAWTHLKLDIFPDGGVARLRVYGRPASLPAPRADGLVELSSALGGARAIAWNDAHYGDPRHLLLPGLGERMEDGWETRRRREPGHDWCIIRLGTPGRVAFIEIDTRRFKGNYPDTCSVQGVMAPRMADAACVPQSLFWADVLTSRKLGPDAFHGFEPDAPAILSHIRFNIFPDGGVNRLRIFGTPCAVE
ncbi:putative allantoicase 2 [Tistrella bauzanensis]|uniref:Probable allantoicase n=1 Tax=Tistrella bauzanensis TaxID=657419 RepID=A0ABQ1IN75_9PROT|nr:allantoicase [Tistrella bauzanensis]GGB45688.1 putative allantoicase 2 [Tistrella bauzanensis]